MFIGGDVSLCEGELLTFMVSGGNNWLWIIFFGNMVMGMFVFIGNVIFLDVGYYVVIVINVGGCFVRDFILIVVNLLLVVNVSFIS